MARGRSGRMRRFADGRSLLNRPFLFVDAESFDDEHGSSNVTRERLSERPHGDRHRNHAGQRQYRDLATAPAIVRSAVVRAPRPHRIGDYTLTGSRGIAGFGQGIAFAGTGGDGIPPATSPRTADRNRPADHPRASDFLSEHWPIRG